MTHPNRLRAPIVGMAVSESDVIWQLKRQNASLINSLTEAEERAAKRDRDNGELISLLREVLEHNTPSLELRERISAMVSPSGCKQEKPRAAVGETETERRV